MRSRKAVCLAQDDTKNMLAHERNTTDKHNVLAQQSGKPDEDMD